MEAVAILRNCPLSPRKMRLVVDQVRGQRVEKALATLQFSQRKYYALYVEKLLKAPLPIGNRKITPKLMKASCSYQRYS